MRARILRLHFQTRQRLERWKKEAEADGAYRVAKRLHAVLLNHDGCSSGEIAAILDAPRSKVSQWLSDYEEFGHEALLEGQRSGRPGQLDNNQKVVLGEIIDRGPLQRGFASGVWNAPMIGRVIAEEFEVQYTSRHVRRLLQEMGFSVQRPKRILARANRAAQQRWRRYTYPSLKKKRRPRAPS
jgi:transposase